MISFGDYAKSYQSKMSGAPNYEAWKFKMKNILMQEMFQHLVSLDPKKVFME
jgi:hypothetical protein